MVPDVAPRRSEDRARAADRLSRELLAHTSEPACVTDANGVFKFVVGSHSALAYAPSELLGTSAFDLVHSDDLEVLRDAYAGVVSDPSSHPEVLYRARAKSGAWRWREVHLTNLLDDPILAGIVWNVNDVTEQRELLQELRGADARQRAIVARSRDATLFFDIDGTIRWASPVAPDLLRVDVETLVGMNGLEFVHPDDQERVFGEFFAMTGLGDHVRIEFRVLDTHGDVRWIEEDATNLVDDPDVGFVVGNIREITDRKHAEQELERLALHDQLTDLPNRSLVVDRLEQLVDRGTAAGVLDIDLDNFGDVNESLGHVAGDALLRLVAQRFAGAAAESPSTLARVGGDQFILLCDDVHDATTAVAVAERLRQSLMLPFRIGSQELFVTASVGVALSPGDATGLLRDAGIARQRAKQQGRDRVIVFDATLDVTQQHRLAVQSDLRVALARGELAVWYQPIVDLQSGGVSGVEALVRWNHPVRGLLGPEHFIDIAASSGLICSVGSHVLRQACAAAQTWRQLGTRFRISVNAASAQLSSRAFVAEIEAAIGEYGLDPGQLTIELTESAAMQVADSLENLLRIRALGVHLSLDDFGTGYSSLTFLRELPVDEIKVDRSFVNGLGTNRSDTSIVQGVIAMAAALGYEVVAEGVETPEQAKILRQIGCRYAQGFLWSRPAPASAVRAIVSSIEDNLALDPRTRALLVP